MTVYMQYAFPYFCAVQLRRSMTQAEREALEKRLAALKNGRPSGLSGKKEHVKKEEDLSRPRFKKGEIIDLTNEYVVDLPDRALSILR